MKTLVLVLAIFGSITSVKAQSLDRYDYDFRRSHLVQGALTATGELVIAGALVASYSPKVAAAFWKKILPTESAKLANAIAEKNKAEIKRLSQELKAARTAKLRSLRFVGPGIATTVKVFGWVRKGVIVYALFDSATRAVMILTDKPALDDSQLDQVSPEELQQLLP